MKKIILSCLLALLSFVEVKSQITQTTWTWQYNQFGSLSYNVIIYRPVGAVGKLPCFVFFPGSGESVSPPSALYVNGPLNFIQSGWRPTNFIIVAAQTYVNYPGDPLWVQNVLDSVFKPSFNADTTRVYLTGLSYGAATTMGYLQDTINIHKIAAAIPMSININPSSEDGRFKTMPLWGFCGSADDFYTTMSNWFVGLQAQGDPAIFTVIPGQGHCCWNTNYNPTWTQNGLNIYDWALQFPNTDLAITWGDFGYDEATNSLIWNSIMEDNASHYDIQESTDGTNWSTIGSVPAKDTEANYTFKL